MYDQKSRLPSCTKQTHSQFHEVISTNHNYRLLYFYQPQTLQLLDPSYNPMRRPVPFGQMDLRHMQAMELPEISSSTCLALA